MQRILLAVFVVVVSGLSGATKAEGGLSAPSGQCQMGYWSSNRNLDTRKDIGVANCLLTWRQRVTESTRVVFSGRGGYGFSGEAGDWTGRVREAYVDAESGRWSLRLGRQVLAWGRADRINPTDNLAPRDFTLLVAEDEDQRMGIDAARLRYEMSPSLATSAVLARFTAHKTPTGLLPPNVVRVSEPNRAEWALKLDHTGSIDWSVSYFNGYERFARYAAVFLSPASFVFQRMFERSRVLGFDAATAAGAWTVRTEMAYADLSPDCTNCVSYKRKVTRAVIGADRDFWETANVNVQLFALRRSNYVDPMTLMGTQQSIALGLDRLNSEFGRDEWGFTLRLSQHLFNERLKLEFSGIADMTNHSSVLRPRLVYAYSDGLRLGAGADRFQGKMQSFFGSRKANDTVFIEATLVF